MGRHRRKPILGNSRSGRNQCVIAGLLAKPTHGTGAGIPFVPRGTYQSRTSLFRGADGNVLEFDLEDLVETVIAVFRYHPHINNVFTHICGGQWERIGHALRVILNPLATLNDLSPLAQNIVELMSAERGVTGRILRPYFNTLLGKVLPPQLSAHLCRHVLCLSLEIQTREHLQSEVTVR